jgi:hypothetical protein
MTLLQKRFIVSTAKSFFVSVSPADTIFRIQKIDYFSYRLFSVDTQNRFSKIKKNRSLNLGTLALDQALLADARQGRRCCRISSGLRRAVGGSRPSRSWSSGASSPRPPRTPCRHRAPPPSRFRLEPPLETGATAAFQIWTSSVSSRRAPLSACHDT